MIEVKLTHMARMFGLVVAMMVALSLAVVSSASANRAWWNVTSASVPTRLTPGGAGTVQAVVENVGDAATSGTPVVVVDRLPVGLTVQSASLYEENRLNVNTGFFCTTEPHEVRCEFPGLGLPVASLPLYPYEALELDIVVKVGAAEAGEQNTVEVSGGEGPAVSMTRPVDVGAGEPPFGVSDYELKPESEGGIVDTRAGTHPFQLTTNLLLNQSSQALHPPALAKDLRFELPPGLVGNPTPFPRCSDVEFATTVTGGVGANFCPADTAVGAALIMTSVVPAGGGGTIYSPGEQQLEGFPVPVFNLTPLVGEPARFGFLVARVPVILDVSVRTGGDYGVTVSVKNISQFVGFVASRVTFWGVPGDERHENDRGWKCIAGERWGVGANPGTFTPCAPLHETHPAVLLTSPTSCTAQPLQTSVLADSWSERADVLSFGASLPLPAMDGCNRLPFAPSISVAPDGQAASTPTGLTVGVHVPQEEALNPAGLAPADVKDTTVRLPSGVALNPAAADGLLSCSEAQIGLSNGVVPSCPEASKVATLEIETPLLPDKLEGAAYLAAQNANPFGSLFALYLVAQDPVSGTLVKLAGEVKPDPVTGQLVSTFKNTPQLPFEDLKLHFFGGSRAPLSTPVSCGAYTTMASITPWSADPANEAGSIVSPTSTFNIVSGPNGTPCPSPLPFDPSLTAGTTSIQAGGLSPFAMTMSREDGNQNLQAISLHMPPGLSGLLSSVKLCGQAQANAGTCGPESEIGETIVSVGLGGDPFSVKGGKVYVTEGYDGAPYGLSIVNPAKAGPFDLEKDTPCDCVIVRAKIEVDPTTAALTITSDSTGPYKIPTILAGVPLQIKHVNVTVNRPGFTFNPTNCDPMRITGSLTSTQGTSSALSVPFQVTNCAILGFKPGFVVSTNGKTSRATGASLHVKLTYPKAKFGSQANIRSVKVDLPKQLPSQLKTLQKACPDRTFSANPANCDPASRIGTAKATTPLLPVPLTGPVYFVSHAGLKFPELVIVLSGYGTTVQLHAETFISKTGITSSTFRTVPDVPVGTFELTLPQGKFPALAAPGNNLCKEKLKMPTVFTAQNGAQIKQATPIGVTGCAKHKGKKTNKHKRKK